VQRDDERAPLLLVGALGEQLLKLVDHQQQPRGLLGGALRPARLRHGGLPRGERESRRIGVEPSPHPSRSPGLQACRRASAFIQFRPFASLYFSCLLTVPPAGRLTLVGLPRSGL
jgi:hypothetical protein